MVKAIARGKVDPELHPMIYGGRLVALDKGNGKVRPIVVGEYLVKLAATVLLQDHATVLAQHFEAEDQMGVAVKGGSELVIHNIRTVLIDLPRSGLGVAETARARGLLKVDFANAFNTISRRLIREALVEGGTQYTDLLTYFDAHYPTFDDWREHAGEFPRLIVPLANGTTFHLLSAEGVQQGDPLAPVFFALGLSKMMKVAFEIMGAETTNNTYSPSYLDDLMAVSHVDHLVRFDLAVRLASQRTRAGLVVNGSKCQFYFPNCTDVNTLQSQIHATYIAQGLQLGIDVQPGRQPRLVLPREGVTVLGAPIGDDEWVSQQLNASVTETGGVLAGLAQHPQPQIQMRLTRFCQVPRATFMLRTGTGRPVQEACVQHDRQIQQHLTSTLAQHLPGVTDRFSLTEQQLDRAALPLILGGLGLTRAADIRPIAAMASAATAVPKMTAHPVIRRFLGLTPQRGEDDVSGTGWRDMCKLGDSLLQTLGLETSQVIRLGEHHDVFPAWSSFTAMQQGLDHVWSTFHDTCAQEEAHVGLRARFREGKYRELAKHAPADIPSLLERTAATTGRGSKMQHDFTTLWARAAFVKVYNATPEERRSTLVSQTQSGASEWLDCTPFTRKLQLGPEVYTWSVMKQIGGDTAFDEMAKRCPCTPGGAGEKECRNDWDHANNCKFGGWTISRHDRVRDFYGDLFLAAKAKIKLELRGVISGLGSGGPDLLVTTDKDLAIEVAVGNPSASTAGARRALSQAVSRERGKRRKYLEKVTNAGMHYETVTLETTGAMGQDSKRVMKMALDRMRRYGLTLVPAHAPWSSQQPGRLARQQLSVLMRVQSYKLASRSAEEREKKRVGQGERLEEAEVVSDVSSVMAASPTRQ